MKKRESIRGRLVAASVLLAAIIIAFFGAVSVLVNLTIRHEFIDQRLSSSAELWAGEAFNRISSKPAELEFLRGAEIPPEFRGLKAGMHSVQINGRSARILIAEDRGERYAVIDDRSDYLSIEFISMIAVGVSFLAAIILAVIIGRANASRVILPLTKLAKAVQDGWASGKLPGLEATDEIGILARAIEDRNERLLSALQRERYFTADVSHELRTPLTIMIGSAEVLHSRLREHPELQLMAERIRRNASATALQVGALLKLAQSPETSARVPINLRSLVAHEVDRYRPLLRGKQVELSFRANGDVHVEAVPELVSIAVGNLIRNACQYTNEGKIDVCLLDESITIRDTGLGIPQKVRERLFDRFNRGEQDSSSGTGIGLSIVKRVVNYLGWEITLDAVDGPGCMFTIHFQASSPGRTLTLS
ncbi:sensor histidine kinase [Pseudomonas huaxiensis]|uniref:sensor histidine kinase n=1 Tax=Pseudomonas huaxiensis TaxID=2213017 RepID=UPI000DA68742|nr:HAMP domain-containing sensor histidine kinase [Pseudomonas huaxiensis]